MLLSYECCMSDLVLWEAADIGEPCDLLYSSQRPSDIDQGMLT